MNAPPTDGPQGSTSRPNPPVSGDSPPLTRERPRPTVDPSRPFGAHLRMAWWKPLVVVAVPPLVMLALQVLSWQLVGVIEGSDDPMSPTMTPLKSLAINISIFAAGVVAVLLLARIAAVPWRSLISSPRGFDARRLRTYLVGATLLVGVGLGVVALVAPDSPGWKAFGLSGTTIGLLVVTLLTTPLQSAGEELWWRSAVLPAAASWVRAVRPALAVGLVVSSLGFAMLHGSNDPWLFGYYTVVGLCTGLMAIISRGIEAPVAFHVANNVLFGIVNTVLADGEPYAIDRSTDSGDASLLILGAVNIAMVVLVWLRERRSRGAGAS
ncbi:CPBP family intramembrane glutamic endopeptidase [Micromonospora sp. NPDC053740]|uniref:CPBP family intramembrane glutamic endopeptidase n=1 Tax=Micromonospora TaxID=1873 RepID=UPI001EE93E56|nr:CPBP family intramembrane glutamic endopeptidase [Micromonospora alfalfae]MCG5462493.1 CPBP family intramembrane metalloprotease [Micromonospora alfalfae]